MNESVKDIDRRIKQLQSSREDAVQHENNMKCAEAIRDLYECYVAVGFTEEEAYDILMTQIQKA